MAGQLFDVVFLLALVFAALFLPLWLKIAVPSRVEKLPDGVSYTLAADGTTKKWTGLTWEKLGQNPTMQAAVGEARLHRRDGRRHHHPAASTTPSTRRGLRDHRRRGHRLLHLPRALCPTRNTDRSSPKSSTERLIGRSM